MNLKSFSFQTLNKWHAFFLWAGKANAPSCYAAWRHIEQMETKFHLLALSTVSCPMGLWNCVRICSLQFTGRRVQGHTGALVHFWVPLPFRQQATVFCMSISHILEPLINSSAWTAHVLNFSLTQQPTHRYNVRFCGHVLLTSVCGLFGPHLRRAVSRLYML